MDFSGETTKGRVLGDSLEIKEKAGNCGCISSITMPKMNNFEARGFMKGFMPLKV